MNITKDNFKEIVENNETVIIDFWASWCGPCRALSPVIDTVSERYPDVFFGKVNVDEEDELAALFKIRSIPFVCKIKNGKMVDSFLGYHDEDDVDEFFKR